MRTGGAALRAACAFLALAGCGGARTKGVEYAPAEKVTGPRLRVAVVEFENKTAYGARLGTASADILVTELAKTDRFILVERAKLDKILAEQKLGLSGAIDSDTVAKMGKLLGAAAIVTGAVSEFGVKTRGSDYLITESKRQYAEAVVDVRIIDAETGQILHAESGKGKADAGSMSILGMGTKAGYDETLEGKALRDAIVKFAGNVVNRLSLIAWSCRVAEVDGPKLYLDAGQRSGLKVGDVLVVIRLGDEIKSPATGVVIGRKETRIGAAKVTGFFGDDGAVAEMADGIGPAKGDMCRLPVGAR